MTEQAMPPGTETKALAEAEAMTGAEASAAVDGERPDSGTAVIEFVFAAVVLLIPVIYLMLTLSQLQSAGYATTSAAISASRVAARDADASEERALELATMHFADFGLDDVPITIEYSCSGPCGEAGSLVTAHVETDVSLPGLPLLFGPDNAPHITLRAEHSDVVATAGR